MNANYAQKCLIDASISSDIKGRMLVGSRVLRGLKARRKKQRSLRLRFRSP